MLMKQYITFMKKRILQNNMLLGLAETSYYFMILWLTYWIYVVEGAELIKHYIYFDF